MDKLIATTKPRVLVEIGVWRGDTAIRIIRAAAMRRADIEYWGFDLFREGMTPELHALETSLWPSTAEEVRRRLTGLGATVNLVQGDTKITLAKVDLPPIDFAFIDGGHSYETVKSDWRNVASRLAPGATVVFDDYVNDAAAELHGIGVTKLVDQLRSDYNVTLGPADSFRTSYGKMVTRLAIVTSQTNTERLTSHSPRRPPSA